MYIADMLSRAFITDLKPKEEEDFEIFKLQQEDQVFKYIKQSAKSTICTCSNPHKLNSSR